MNAVPVDGYTHLKRDISSGAIMNTNFSEYDNYIKLKKNKELEKVKFDTALDDISTLKSEISEIKNLLLTLVKNNERL